MKQGIFPESYKIAKVVPLYKGGDKENVNNYRPISLLPALGKLLEKVVSNRLIDYLDNFDLITPHQFGFRKNYGTEYAIMDIHEKLLHNLEEGTNTCSVFLDLAKAFDSVNHTILLQKLHKYGIRGNMLSFFKSYLESRSQFTFLNNHSSSSIFIRYGVPQGSILGPILFLLLTSLTRLHVSLKSSLMTLIYVLMIEICSIYKSQSMMNLTRFTTG